MLSAFFCFLDDSRVIHLLMLYVVPSSAQPKHTRFTMETILRSDCKKSSRNWIRMIGLAFLKLLDSKLSIYYNRSLRYAVIHM